MRDRPLNEPSKPQETGHSTKNGILGLPDRPRGAYGLRMMACSGASSCGLPRRSRTVALPQASMPHRTLVMDATPFGRCTMTSQPMRYIRSNSSERTGANGPAAPRPAAMSDAHASTRERIDRSTLSAEIEGESRMMRFACTPSAS